MAETLEDVLRSLEALAAEALRRTGAPHVQPEDGAAVGELRAWAVEQGYHARVAAGVALQAAWLRRFLLAQGSGEAPALSTSGLLVNMAHLQEWGAVLRLLESLGDDAVLEVSNIQDVFPLVGVGIKVSEGASSGGHARAVASAADYCDIYDHYRKAGESPKSARLSTAEHFGVTERTIYRALKKR